jgi:hypothetical protein
VLAHRAGELIALRGEIGERARQIGEGFFRRRQRLVIGSDARIGATARLRIGLGFVPQRLFLGGQT